MRKVWPLFVMGAMALPLLRVRPRRDRRLRHALVTGGSRGLGFAVAQDLLEQGVRVSICGRDEAALGRAREKLERYGSVRAFRIDLADAAEVDRLLEDAAAEHGPIDLLVNNAAGIQVGPLEATRYEDYERLIRINFLAPLRLVLGVLPGMRERRFGRIVNVGSIGGRVSAPHLLPYGASKFALVGLSEGLRAELASTGVRVTTVCPGLTRTGSPGHATFRGRATAEHTWFAISDSLPFLSGDARRTARRIVDAAFRGDAELVTTLPAIVGSRFHGLAPGCTADLLGWVERAVLPRAPRTPESGVRRGRDVRSPRIPSALLRWSDRAATDLNQEPEPAATR